MRDHSDGIIYPIPPTRLPHASRNTLASEYCFTTTPGRGVSVVGTVATPARPGPDDHMRVLTASTQPSAK